MENDEQLIPDPEETLEEFQPETLSEDDAIRLANALTSGDPAMIAEARELISRSVYGADSNKVRSTLRKAQELEQGLRARAAAENFVQETPEYAPTVANKTKMLRYMNENKMAGTRKNFEIAFNALKSQLDLEEPEAEEPTPQPATGQPQQLTPQQRANVTKEVNKMTPGEKQDFKRMVDQMSADEYRYKILNDPSFEMKMNLIG